MSKQYEFEHLLALYCAPVLKGHKVANMFHVSKQNLTNIIELVQFYAVKLQKYGIYFHIFQNECQRVTVYVYRKNALKLRLRNSKIKTFLHDFNYPEDSLDHILEHLDIRLCENDGYPHEIGIFLGYPLEDIQGFIHHLPCKLVGYWKVYSDTIQAKLLFKQFDLARKELLDGIYSGYRIEQLLIN